MQCVRPPGGSPGRRWPPGSSTAKWALGPRASGALAPALLQLAFLLPVSNPPFSLAHLGGGSSGALPKWEGWSPTFALGPGLFAPPSWPNGTTTTSTVLARPAQPPQASVPRKGQLGRGLKGKPLSSHSQKGCQWACGSGWSRKGSWWSTHQVPLRTVHNPTRNLGSIPHSSVLAWRIPGTGEPGGLPSMGLHRVGHDWSDLAAAAPLPQWEDKLIANCI